MNAEGLAELRQWREVLPVAKRAVDRMSVHDARRTQFCRSGCDVRESVPGSAALAGHSPAQHCGGTHCESPAVERRMHHDVS